MDQIAIGIFGLASIWLANAVPPVPAIIPVKKSCWWDGVKSGRFPKPVKLGPRVTAWRVEDIRALVETWAAERNYNEGNE